MALSFEITINDERPITAGAEDVSVLVATLTYSLAGQEIELRVGGLVSNGRYDNEDIEWLQRDARIGDRITIRILETAAPSLPASRTRRDPKFLEEEERKYYEQLKRRFEPQ